jgi:tryptophan-rich sensory protein
MTDILINLVIFYGILVGINIFTPLLGLSFESNDKEKRVRFEPPGFLIPIVWFLLFTLLGIAHYIVDSKESSELNWLIIGLAILCASYAYYTLGLAKLTGISALWFGFIGNFIVIIASILVAIFTYPVSQTVAFLIAPVTIWTSFANYIVYQEMKQEKLL